MLQRALSALRRVARPVCFSRWIPRTGVPILEGCGETHNRMKTNRNPQLFSLMSTSAGQVHTRRARSTVNSLDPDRLHISDIIELSGSNYPSAIFGTSGVCVLHYHSTTPPGRTRKTPVPFPPGTRGFLYLHRRPCLPPGAGEIRFRVLDPGYVSDSATELFARGKDLLDHADHAPWRIHMLHLYTKAQGVHIRRLLLRQGLITPSQDATVQQCYPADKKIIQGIHSSLRGYRIHLHCDYRYRPSVPPSFAKRALYDRIQRHGTCAGGGHRNLRSRR